MVVDTFLFYNELDLLEIRLEELKDVVDCFVLVEAGETHSGKAKSLYFQENKSAFNRFPIQHISIDKFPSHFTTSWQRENHPRHLIAQRLKMMDLSPSDLVMLSDLDEIPRAETVAKCVRSLPREVGGTVYVFQQDLSYYYANCRANEPWLGTRMARWRDITDMQALRASGGVQIPNAGWHLSYLGGADRVRDKVGASAHTELDRVEFLAEDHIDQCLTQGTDLFGRNQSFEFIKLDSTFPKFLVENKGRFAGLVREHHDETLVTQLYEESCLTPSDIFEHVPYLFKLGSLCNHITELGTRAGKSTSAFIYARPKRLIAYDLERGERVSLLEQAAQEAGVEFTFHQEDVLETDIEPTDLLFIDTWHVEGQMRQELARHADKARLYLVFHDTESFGHVGETRGHRGIWPPISAFMRTHPEWSLLQHFPNNNGLTVFTRLANLETGGTGYVH